MVNEIQTDLFVPVGVGPKTAFERWIGSTGEETWASLIQMVLNDLRAVVVGSP